MMVAGHQSASKNAPLADMFLTRNTVVQKRAIVANAVSRYKLKTNLDMIRVTQFTDFCEQGSRDNHEDYIVVPGKDDVQQRVFVLCDGKGGHGHGEVASQTIAVAVDEYLKMLKTDVYTAENLQYALDYAVEQLEKADVYNDEKRMGTTLVVVVVNNENVLVGHVGDSRCYLLDKDGNIKFCTKDHSEVQQAVEMGFITEEEAWDHPKKNIITRCVQAGRGKIKLTVDELEDIYEGDRLFLCSDGVNDALRDKEIVSALMADSDMSCLKDKCAELSKDNYSGILISLDSDKQPPLKPEESSSDEETPKSEECPDRLQYCTRCGSENKEVARFCKDCGQDLSMMSAPACSSENEIKKNRIDIFSLPPKIAWLIIALLSGFCIYLAIVHFMGNDQDYTNVKDENIERLKSDNDELRNYIKKLEADLETYNRLRDTRLRDSI